MVRLRRLYVEVVFNLKPLGEEELMKTVREIIHKILKTS